MKIPNFSGGDAGARFLAAVVTEFFVIAAMIALRVAEPPMISRVDQRIYDMLLPLRAAPAPSPVPVIIDIDEASLAEYGQWPWPRYLVADLLKSLREYGVAATGMDIMFAEPDNSSPKQVSAHLKRDRNVTVKYEGLPDELGDFDEVLSEELKRAPVALGAYANPDPSSEPPDIRDAVKIIPRALRGAIPYETRLSSTRGATLPLPALRVRARIGFMNVDPDSDGIVRKIPLLIRVGENIYPSLALRTLMLGLGTENIVARHGPDGLESVAAGKFSAHSTPAGEMYIPFIGPRGTYRYYSAADVMKRRVPPGELAGKLAFVGTSSAGLLDIRATPLDKVYPGVETHAAAVDALTAGNSISVPSWTSEMQISYIFVSGIIAMIFFGLAPPLVYIPVAGALIGGSVVISRYFFGEGYFVSPLYSSLTVAATGASILLSRFRRERKQRIMLKKTFSRYVSPKVVNRIMRERGNPFAGEERTVSIMFSDVRGFTSISERLTPRQTVNLLNEYFTPMTAVIQDRDGTLDKFIGDAIMAFWNAPLDVPGHPARALDAALSMREKLDALNAELSSKFGVTLEIGAGVHTGAVYVGNMGSRDLVNYTLIGDNVNLASRLEGLCPYYGVGAVTSGQTKDGAGESFSFQYLDTIRVKGKTEPVTVYVPMRPQEASSRAAELSDWSAAATLYLDGKFNESTAAFRELSERHRNTKLYPIYQARSETLEKSPPEKWDGAWTMASK
jgi:adenylate cyclase